MNTDQQTIDLATRIQRRRDFGAHAAGFAGGAAVLSALFLAGVSCTALYLSALLAWAAALSFQHFRHVVRGPVTAAAVRDEAARLSRTRQNAPAS